MESFSDLIKAARETKGLILRQVAAAVDIDQAIISKFERGERKPSKVQVQRLAAFYGLDQQQLITAWLSDAIAYSILQEHNVVEVLKAAEEKVTYLKALQNEK